MTERGLLVLSPNMKGGSFLATVLPIERSGYSKRSAVASLIVVKERAGMFGRVFGFPRYWDYSKYGVLLAGNPFASFLYNFPLYILASWLTLILRPKVIVSNGLLTSLPMLLIARALGAKVILSYNGKLENYVRAPTLRRLAPIADHLVDYAFANSSGSKKDLATLIHPTKVLVVVQTPPDSFMNPRSRQAVRKSLGVSDKFVVLYSGWLNREKRCDKLLNVVKAVGEDARIEFWFAGDGELKRQVLSLQRARYNVRYFGYLRDMSDLANLYVAADLVWTIADTTYVARSGVEAMACGTPIIVPDVPGVQRSAQDGIKIPHNLIPADVGWVVSDDDTESLRSFIKELSSGRRTEEMREACMRYSRTGNSKDVMAESSFVISRLMSG